MNMTLLPAMLAGQPPDLTQDEIDMICDPLKQPAAQIRYLQRLGVHVRRKPNGKPLVNRLHYVSVRGGSK
jgi:hypothetical protein